MDPETAAFVRVMETTLPAAGTEITDATVLRDMAARIVREPGPQVARVEDIAVRPGAGEAFVPCRLYEPALDGLHEGVVVFLHGGGWVQGDLESHDATCRRLALGAGCRVLGVDYAKAPERPFPAAIEDVIAAVRWVRCQPSLAGPCGIVGESAGGNIAAAVTLWMRDREERPLDYQALVYPVTDHCFDTGSYRQFARGGGFLTEARMRWYWSQYLGNTDGSTPLASPLRADLDGLPSALVLVAECDPVRDEGLAYANRLAAAGNNVTVSEVMGGFHGMLSAAERLPVAASTFAELCTWVRRAAAAAT